MTKLFAFWGGSWRRYCWSVNDLEGLFSILSLVHLITVWSMVSKISRRWLYSHSKQKLNIFFNYNLVVKRKGMAGKYDVVYHYHFIFLAVLRKLQSSKWKCIFNFNMWLCFVTTFLELLVAWGIWKMSN